MNRLKELQEKRGAKLKEASAITKKARDEKRELSADEQTKLTGLHGEIESIDSTIVSEARQLELEARGSSQKPAKPEGQLEDQRLGLSAKEIRGYSLMKVIRALASKSKLDGIEAEASQAEAKRVGRDPQGVFVPFEVLASVAHRNVRAAREARNQDAGTFADGGALVETNIDYGNMVELLRNQSHIMQLGARMLTGLVGDLAIPRQLTGATAYWLSETGQITASKATFGQIAMKPRRLGAAVPYTNQLLAQSGMGIEAFVREDILASFATELDRAAINGAGGAEPLGIFNLASGDRATGVTFGAAPTWAKVVSFETNVENANALALANSRLAYLTTPGVKGAWKTTSKVSNTAVFLWENGDLVNGYPARSTSQVPSNKVIFGDFSQVIFGEWTGNDITVDPYTLADQNQVRVVINKHVDIAIRQSKAFSVSSDSGAQ